MRLLVLAFLIGCAPVASFDAGDLPPPAQQERDVELSVWFAPDEDLLPIELAEIDRVRLARLADPSAPADAYAIRYAVYNLRHEAIAQGLVDARNAGVSVQVLIDADQLDPARDWNWADEFLTLNGFSFAPDHRTLLTSAAADTNLIGIAGTGLMHLKTRIFRTPDATRVLTGSHNPGEDAMTNDEALHLVREPAVVAAYERAFDATRADLDYDNVWVDGAPVNALFSPSKSGPRAVNRLFDWISEENEQILILAYSLRDLTAPDHEGTLLDLLGAKVASGVPVVLVTDRKQSDPEAFGDSTEDRLRERGVRVYEVSNTTTEFTAMHHKSVILGRSSIRVISDAANFTAAGFGNAARKATNQESTLFLDAHLDDGRVGRRYLGQAMRVLGRYAWQAEAEGEAPYDELAAELTSLPGWPVVPVHFAVEAQTSLGEQLHATGDLPALGQWGAAGWGVPLVTDEASYPVWAADPVDLPVGARFTWKYTAVDGSNVRWEAGDDRSAHAVPDADGSSERVSRSDVWR
jgi:hypothetical protein